MSALKTIAEFMGWELFFNDPDADDHYCTEEFNHENGALTVHYFRPHACRDDLQLVLEKIAEDDNLFENFSGSVRKAVCEKWPRGHFFASPLYLPTQTLADICAAVIGETK